MTAEIAILNRNAVAMAADSAVTLQMPGGQKIYNTVNKLFMLSKYRPVGVMVYGSGDFMQVPWETIIKMYRTDLYDKAYPHLEDYASDFIEFFARETSIFPTELQRESASTYLRLGFLVFKREIDREVQRTIREIGAMDEEQVRTLVKNKVIALVEELEKCQDLPGVREGDIQQCAVECEKEIQDAIQTVFEKLPIDEVREQLIRSGSLILCKQSSVKNNYSGVVIAGYGEKDLFPSLVAYECECVINNRLRYIETNRTTIGVRQETAVLSSVNPFAQREMVNRFMEGVDPRYRDAVESYILLTKGYPDKIANALGGKVSEELQDSVRKELIQLGSKLAEDFDAQLAEFRQREFIGPVIDSVAYMPKDELAAMAESLVNLTAFKRRMTSVETDTVGLPIDVAVISKGDGFVWIKRKHYFRPELNHHFFSNYYLKR